MLGIAKKRKPDWASAKKGKSEAGSSAVAGSTTDTT